MSFTLVTGAAKNLGKKIALHLAQNGQNMAIHYNKSYQQAYLVAETCKSYGVKAEVIQGDFSTAHGVIDFIERYERLIPTTKYLVNNVGNYLVKSPGETTLTEMSDLFETNLYAPFLLIKALLPTMIKEKGSVVNMGAAGISENRAESYSTAYSLTKSSLLMLTKSLAKECAPKGVTLNMVSPGVLENSEDGLKALPMQRTALFQEVAEAVLFLLKSPYITGQNLEVAGGVRL